MGEVIEDRPLIPKKTDRNIDRKRNIKETWETRIESTRGCNLFAFGEKPTHRWRVERSPSTFELKIYQTYF